MVVFPSGLFVVSAQKVACGELVTFEPASLIRKLAVLDKIVCLALALVSRLLPDMKSWVPWINAYTDPSRHEAIHSQN